jgi:hypothetical protein
MAAYQRLFVLERPDQRRHRLGRPQFPSATATLRSKPARRARRIAEPRENSSPGGLIHGDEVEERRPGGARNGSGRPRSGGRPPQIRIQRRSRGIRIRPVQRPTARGRYPASRVSRTILGPFHGHTSWVDCRFTGFRIELRSGPISPCKHQCRAAKPDRNAFCT